MSNLTLKPSLEQQRSIITKALQQSNGHKGKAAELLGISRKTLYTKMKQYKVETILLPIENASL